MEVASHTDGLESTHTGNMKPIHTARQQSWFG